MNQNEKNLRQAYRLDKVLPSPIRKTFAIANEKKARGERVLDFGIGDIDLGCPRVIREAITRSLTRGETMYGPDPGEPSLRIMIANRYNNKYGIDIGYNNVLVTVGAMEGLLDTFLAYINPGDEILLQDPSFANFKHQISIAGGITTPLLTKFENEFKIMPETIQELITPKTKGILINYPTNPTSMTISHELKAIVEICEDNGLLLISDESYESLYYDSKKHVSALEFNYDRTIVISSVSKSMCATGIRLGFAIGLNNQIMKPIFQIHQYNTVHASKPIQYGIIEGFKHEKEIIGNNLRILTSRRKVAMDSWSKIPGLKLIKPKAGFFLYPEVSDTGMTASEFCEFALGHGVVLVSGDGFNISKPETQHVRMSFGVGTEELIEEGANILIEALK